MKYKTFLIPLIIFTNIVLIAQNQANIWHFGKHAGVDFNTGEPIVIPYVPFIGLNANASISDSLGDFLFSCNGKKIWNRGGQIMQNGDGLLGHIGSSQGSLILQKPGSENLYYVFTVAYYVQPIGMHYSVVDLNMDGGQGAVTSQKNIPLNAAWDALEKLTSVRHANGHDIWIIIRKFTEDGFAAFLLTSSGLNEDPVYSPRRDFDYAVETGSMKVSPNKRYLAIAYTDDTGASKDHQASDICNFNSSTGEIELLYTLTRTEFNSDPIIEPWAVEFSPDSKLLYVSYYNEQGNVDSMELFQYDMQYIEDSLQFKQSETYIATGPVNGLQLARDGKIYCTGDSYGDYNYLSVIHKPWEKGLDCNYEADAVFLGAGKAFNFLPNILTDHLFRFEWQGTCSGPDNTITFQPNFIPEPAQIKWDFGDGNTSSELWPIHTYETGGEYEIYVHVVYPPNVNYPFGRIEETSRIIEVFQSPAPDLGNDTLMCENETIILNAGIQQGMYIWSTGDFGQNLYEITISDTGTYWVRVTNTYGCSTTDSIIVSLYDKALIDEQNLIITPTSCGGSNGTISGIQVSGVQPLNIAWYDGDNNLISTNIDISNLSVGNYFLHITDGNGCLTISDSYTIIDSGDILITNVDTEDSHCSSNNGSISITATSGASNNFSYSIDNGINWENSSLFENLPAGEYVIRVKDQSDCETVYVDNPVLIIDIDGPTINEVITSPENDNLGDGQINIIATNLQGSIFYSINGGSTFQVDNGLFSSLTAGIYTCVVKDEYDCDTTFIIELERNNSQIIDAIAGNGYTCIGNATASPLLLTNFKDVFNFKAELTYNNSHLKCDGYIQVHPELEENLIVSIDDQGTVNITWQGQSPLSLEDNAKMVELVFSGIAEGQPNVEWVADQGESSFYNENGEVIIADYQMGYVRVYSQPEIMLSNITEACEGDQVILSPFITGGSGENTSHWDGPNNFTSNNELLWFNEVHSNMEGIYTLTVTDTVNCIASSNVELIVNKSPEIEFAPYDTLWVEPGYELDAGIGSEYYQWNTGETSEVITIDITGSYSVEVTSYNNCKSSDTVQILWGGIPFYIPNAFTPNGDGLNDAFEAIPKADYIKKYHISIYNRWGQQIFESTDISTGWDGIYQGTPCMPGTYIYRIVYQEFGQQPMDSKAVEGTVMLVR